MHNDVLLMRSALKDETNVHPVLCVKLLVSCELFNNNSINNNFINNGLINFNFNIFINKNIFKAECATDTRMDRLGSDVCLLNVNFLMQHIRLC
jgi:hypothetical protein